MGVSNGGIAIKTDTAQYDLLKVVKDLFGNDFERTDGHCDARRNDCVFAAKTGDLLIVVNTDFAEKFFTSQGTAAVQQYLHYFGNPSFVFAFEEYDSGGTYSYSLIYDGVVKRQYSSVSYEEKADFGELEPVELKWKNAEIIKEDIGDGEFEILYKHPTRDFACSKEQLPQVILQELMLEKLGFTSWSMADFMTERSHFKRAASSASPGRSVGTEQGSKKSWWKLW